MGENWDEKADYLNSTRFMYHNDDYLEFLVKNVLKLKKNARVVEFGCGYGFFGAKIIKHMDKVDRYTGIDQSAKLLLKAWEHFYDSPFRTEFIESDVNEVPLRDNKSDLTLCHALLMHMEDPNKVLNEMIRVTKPGGKILICEANRNAHSALFYRDEVKDNDTEPLGLYQEFNQNIKNETGKDYNIGIKIPVMMHKAGLSDIESRISDKVNLLFPSHNDEEHEKIYHGICNEGYSLENVSEENLIKWKENLVKYGLTELEAVKEIDRCRRNDFSKNGRKWHTVYSGMMTFTIGTVNKK